MKKWKEKRTMGPKNIKWWKCKDEMMVEYRERVGRKYEELDSRRERWRVNGGSTRMHSLGWRRSCVAERRGKVKYTEKQKPRMVDGGDGEGTGGEAGSMEEDRRQRRATIHRLKAPVWPEEEGCQESGGQSTEEYGGRTVPKA